MVKLKKKLYFGNIIYEHIYSRDFLPSGGEPIQWRPLDEKSDGVHWTGSPPEGKSVQEIRIAYYHGQKPFSTLSLLKKTMGKT